MSDPIPTVEAAEEWRLVDAWPGYEVSESGRVRNPEGLEMRPWKLRNGRWQIKLSFDGSARAFLTYQLVAWAFLGPPPFIEAEIAHYDDNRDNNHWRNLRWTTHRDNCADRSRNGGDNRGDRNGAYRQPARVPRGERHGHSKLTEEQVLAIRDTRGGTKRLADRLGVSVGTIKDIRSGKTWRHVADPARLAGQRR